MPTTNRCAAIISGHRVSDFVRAFVCSCYISRMQELKQNLSIDELKARCQELMKIQGDRAEILLYLPQQWSGRTERMRLFGTTGPLGRVFPAQPHDPDKRPGTNVVFNCAVILRAIRKHEKALAIEQPAP
ncbi:MAG: hypothetical protein K2W95_15620 [Candidatus Obscuribacterales bacterium]|nr:hypothetical protein [Candidatus Obscuribacterales bacterium]